MNFIIWNDEISLWRDVLKWGVILVHQFGMPPSIHLFCWGQKLICGQHILPNHRKGFCSGVIFLNRNLEWIVKIIIIFHCQLNFFPKKNLWCGQHVIYPYRPFRLFLTFPLWISFTSIIYILLIFQNMIIFKLSIYILCGRDMIALDRDFIWSG